jgi:hypothetical protein
MSPSVSISFDCTPLRSIARWDDPLDVAPGQQEILARMRRAAQRHGLHNSYYLSNGNCEFHLTNDPEIGLLAFRFEGTVLTDPHDCQTHLLDLSVELDGAVCDWLTASAVAWFRETVVQAVRTEFNRYIQSSDLERTRQRLENVEAEMVGCGGFVGMGV